MISCNSIIGLPFWNIIFGILVWVPTIAIYLETMTYLDMRLIFTLVTNDIWPLWWASSRATTFTTDMVLEVNFVQILVDVMINWHSVCLQEQSLVLILIIDDIRLSLICIYKVVVLIFSLFHKGSIWFEFMVHSL